MILMMNINKMTRVYRYTPERKKWRAHSPREVHYLAYKVSGDSSVHYFENKTLTLRMGTLYLINANETYSVEMNGSGCSYVIEFTGENIPSSCAFDCKGNSKIEAVWSRLMAHKQLDIEVNYHICMSELHALLAIIVERLNSDYYSKDTIGKIRIIERYIMEHYDDRELSMSKLAGFFNVSVQYMRTLFKNEFGMSPYQYLINVRINEAKKLLVIDEISLSQIAADVGFSDVYYFSRVFKKYVGMSPSRYHNSRRNSN